MYVLIHIVITTYDDFRITKLIKIYSVPGQVTQMTMAWQNEQKHYLLQWYNPQRTNAPISGYHVIVEYPNSQSSRSTDKFKIEKTFYINLAETNEIMLDDVCMNLFDKVRIELPTPVD